ncbi:flagellar filament capping protein FliD [Thalassotalea atypica]|uniref:flagellar filament capping protein FliD n=1 Tax=Thalassotalea atypica TaxID=2054316 RepID=UPI0025734911|nr:flagellar filament capping protein FliD [Thalassotalea atypica]
MNVTSAGIGSGLDLEGIIEAYINAEAIPTEIRLQEKEERLKTEISGVGQLKSALNSFESILKDLSDASSFNKQTIGVSNDDISVTTNGFASNGSFDIEVQQLATGSKQQSALFTDSSSTVGAGTITLTSGTDTFDVAIDATDTLSTIRDKINEQSENFGVSVNIINTGSNAYLSFSSEKTGAANELVISSGDAALSGLTTDLVNRPPSQVAQDAQIIIDNNGIVISSDSNEFKNVIEDVTITANKANIGSASTLTISQDEENGKALIDSFINGYNSLMFTMNSLSNPENGELAFDSNIRSIKSQMVNMVTGSISGAISGIDSLDDIGITLNKEGLLEVGTQKYGTLATGTEKLADALANSLDGVGELFAGTNGVSTQLQALLESYTSSDGSLTVRNSRLQAEKSGIVDEYDALEAKLRNYEDTLRKRFTFLDQTVAQYNATSSYLTSVLTVPNSDKD